MKTIPCVTTSPWSNSRMKRVGPAVKKVENLINNQFAIIITNRILRTSLFSNNTTLSYCVCVCVLWVHLTSNLINWRKWRQTKHMASLNSIYIPYSWSNPTRRSPPKTLNVLKLSQGYKSNNLYSFILSYCF